MEWWKRKRAEYAKINKVNIGRLQSDDIEVESKPKLRSGLKRR